MACCKKSLKFQTFSIDKLECWRKKIRELEKQGNKSCFYKS
jgi:hypothetical protein